MDVTISPRFARYFFSVIVVSLVGSTWVMAEPASSTAVFVTDSLPRQVVPKPRKLARGAVRFSVPSAPPVEQAAVQQGTWAQLPSPPPLARPESAKIAVPVVENAQPLADSQQPPEEAAQETPAKQPAQLVLRSPIALVQHLESQRSPAFTKAPLPLQTADFEAVEQARPAAQKPAAEEVTTEKAEKKETLQPFRRVFNQKIQQVDHEVRVRQLPKVDPVAKLLVEAHRLSQDAQTETDYTAIKAKCREAISSGAQGEKKRFAHQLTSWALNRRGQLRLDSDKKLAANADFQTAIDFNPKNWRALHNRAVSLAELGQLAEAFDDFNRVIELNPKYAKAYANRATLYIQANDLQSALEDYQQASSIDPSLLAAEMGQGRACHMLGRLEEAVAHFTKAAQIEPTNPDVICSRGDLLADLGRYAEAMADYARTIDLDPEYGHAYRNGAWLLATCPQREFRDPENAVLGARQALEIGYGERHVALDTLAAALASAGEFDQAVETLNNAIEEAPEELKFTYLNRLQLYQDRLPYRTEPMHEVSQAMYQATDRE